MRYTARGDHGDRDGRMHQWWRGTLGGPATAAAAAVATAKADGAATVNLGDGAIASLPKGTLYVQFNALPQPGAGTLTHAHLGGFVYGVDGTTDLVTGTETKSLKSNQAAFVRRRCGAHAQQSRCGRESLLLHQHSSERGTHRRTDLSRPKGIFAGPDLAPLADGAYSLGLRSVTIQPNGRTAAHKHAGLETIAVPEGTIEPHVQGTAIPTLKAGEGASISADTAPQAWNKGATPAKFLAFFVTAEGKTFSTDVETVP